MVIYSSIYINGSEVSDTLNYSVEKAIGENNSASSFEASLDNFNGYNKNQFEVGDEVTIYADVGSNPPTTKIFTGILEDIKFDGKGVKEKLKLSGRDYTARLMDRTVEPEVYTNLQAGSIVKDIITKYTNDISTSGVQISGTAVIERISFNHLPVFDAVKKMADQADYTFFIDTNKDLHFEPRGGSASGFTFDSGNVIAANFKEQRDTLFNKVWVYGDRYLDGFKETFVAGSPTGGSVFNLLYNPHNTEVTVGGTAIQPGAIEGIASSPGSNVKYLVNYDDKRITFTSGTTQGDNVPASGASVVVNYQRALPIVKVGDNETSKAQYGERVKVIVDKDIKDPATAEALMQRELEKSGDPKLQGTLEIRGVTNIIPGQTCIVNLPNHNVINETYDILEATYDFNKLSNLSEEVLSIKVNEKLPDITDTMKDILNGLRKVQGQDISDSDTITRFQYTAGSVGVRTSGCVVYSRSIAGEGLIWGNTAFGIWETGKWKDPRATSMIYDSSVYGLYDIALYGGAGGNGFILGNNSFGILGTNSLGNALGQWVLLWSGCYF